MHSKSLENGASQLDALEGINRQVRARAKNADRKVKITRASDIKPQAISWLWHEWLPAGKLTILAGAAGTGKTTFALGLAATLTTGGKFPDQTACKEKGNVLIWSSEDAADDTLIPRLIASGADTTRCRFIEGVSENGESVSFDPSQDIPDLHQAVKEIGGVSLLIIDPIVSAVAGDMNKANDVRRSLQPLVDFAAAYNCAIIGITHFAKGGIGKSPQDRVIGSQAFGALARMVWTVAKSEDNTKRVVARTKANIAPDTGGVAYSINMVKIKDPDGRDIETSHAAWEGTIEGTAREILGEVEGEFNDAINQQKDAEDFLRDLLVGGQVSTKQIKADSTGAGYSWRTIERAKTAIKAEAIKGGMREGWYWRLTEQSIRRPPKSTEDREDHHLKMLADFDKSGGLRIDETNLTVEL